MSTTARRSTTSSLLVFSSLGWLIAAGCSGGEITTDENADIARLYSPLRKGEPGSYNNASDYCDGAVKCVTGEGDCDANSQCDTGLVCGTANGLRYNLYYSFDACWPAHCQDGIQNGDETQVDAGGSCGCVLKTFYYDPDGDGYGTNNTAANTKTGCTAPAGWAAVRGDCDDSNASINAGATEVCGDKKDNNCNGQVDENQQLGYYDPDNDGYGTNNTSTSTRWLCGPTANWATVRGDCDDTSASINPAATEVCGDRKDNNCNGQVDENQQLYYYDSDRDGFGTNNTSVSTKWLCAATAGWSTVRGDCDDSNANINPNAWETCDNKDNNCNGQIDETKPTWCQDSDLDGWPKNSCATQCAPPNWTYIPRTSQFDCNDANKNVYPGSFEITNGVDDDCDGTIDNTTVPATCSNNVLDGTETAKDCGGLCKPCGTVTTGPSCTGLANTCVSSQNCCNFSTVYGGTYFRSYDGTGTFASQASPATVNSFRMDLYEVSVGRFRKFVAAYDAWRAGGNPVAGAGANPSVAGTGWDATWTLPASSSALITAVKCNSSQQTWTDAAAATDNRPINCVNFFEASAFCLWDGGRLPTEAEWNYAAAGGSQQRALPWSYPTTTDANVDRFRASFGCILDGLAPCVVADIERAGDFPSSAGRWGQTSMAGGLWEWTWDFYSASYKNPCVNCAQTTASSWRIVRGGSYQSWPLTNLRTSTRSRYTPDSHQPSVGIRCVR